MRQLVEDAIDKKFEAVSWYVPVAQYYYESGNKDRAIELIEVALKSLGDPDTMPDCSKPWPTTRVRRPATRSFAWFRKTRLLNIKAQSPDEQRSQRDHMWNGPLVNSPVLRRARFKCVRATQGGPIAERWK